MEVRNRLHRIMAITEIGTSRKPYIVMFLDLRDKDGVPQLYVYNLMIILHHKVVIRR